MKWYDPPIHATRNPIFETDINAVIEFLVKYLFKRVTGENTAFNFILELDQNLPKVRINEYVIWEILEPLIQNSIDHNLERNVTITLRTKYYQDGGATEVAILDNGKGIIPELLQRNAEGIKKIFLENTSTREHAENSGYGCYIAHELSTKRCGWQIDAANLPSGGCIITLTIPQK